MDVMSVRNSDLSNPAYRSGRAQFHVKQPPAILAEEPRKPLSPLLAHPNVWAAPRVEQVLVEAQITIMAMPAKIGPKAFGCLWPEYDNEWRRQVAIVHAWCHGYATYGDVEATGLTWEDADEIRDMLKGFSITEEDDRPSPPSLAEITRMEMAIGWPGRYLGHGHRRKSLLLTALQRVVWAKSIGRDSEWLARKIGGATGSVWQGRCSAGCEKIAEGLTRDRVVVF